MRDDERLRYWARGLWEWILRNAVTESFWVQI